MSLPDNRDREAEQQAFVNRCHRTKYRRPDAAAILEEESFFNASNRVASDGWSKFFNSVWDMPTGPIQGADILRALRDHLSQLQQERCCYCATPLLRGGNSRPLEHVLARVHYPQFSLYFWNLAVACERCNRLKHSHGSQFPTNLNDYPHWTEFTQQFHPRFHRYNAHIQFTTFATNDFRQSIYVGLTEQGRRLVCDLLVRVALEEAVTTNNVEVASAIEKIDDCLSAQDERAKESLQAFKDALTETIVAQAARL